MPSNNLVVYTNVKKIADDRICPVCGEEAPAGETHHPHYGGICCYSCRAFFRRANQRSKAPNLKCKRDGNCVIVSKSKQICKKCRYRKCIEVGMDSKWVLTNDEKRVRFKNFFKKKDELAMLGPGQQPADTDESADAAQSAGARPSQPGRRGQAQKRKRNQSAATNASSEPTTLSDDSANSADQTDVLEELRMSQRFLDASTSTSSSTTAAAATTMNRSLTTVNRSSTTATVNRSSTSTAASTASRNILAATHGRRNSSSTTTPATPQSSTMIPSMAPSATKSSKSMAPSSTATRSSLSLTTILSAPASAMNPATTPTSSAAKMKPTTSSDRISKQQQQQQSTVKVENIFDDYSTANAPRLTAFNQLNVSSMRHSNHPFNLGLRANLNQFQDSLGRAKYEQQFSPQSQRQNRMSHVDEDVVEVPVKRERYSPPDSSTHMYHHNHGYHYHQQIQQQQEQYYNQLQQYQQQQSPLVNRNFLSLVLANRLLAAQNSNWQNPVPNQNHSLTNSVQQGCANPNQWSRKSSRQVESKVRELSSENQCQGYQNPPSATGYQESKSKLFPPLEAPESNPGPSCSAQASPIEYSDKVESPIREINREPPKSDRWNQFLSPRAQLSTVLDAFTLITGKLTLNSEVPQDLLQIHQRRRPIQKETLISQLGTIASMVTEFASSQFLFKSLTKDDQITLLKNNIPLYLQYVMARYFSAETGIEQLNWILEGQLIMESLEEITKLSRISLNEFNSTVQMFPTSESAELYLRYSENVGMFYPFSQHCSGLVANMLLFYTNDSMTDSLKEPKRISCIFDEAKELVRVGFEHLDRHLYVNAGSNIGPLIHTLSKMKTIFGLCKVHSDGKGLVRNVPQLLAINYTDAEECWLNHRFSQFRTNYASVSPPADFFKDLLILLESCGTVAHNFVQTWAGMTQERMRRVLKSNPEFSTMPDKCQEALWSKNHRSATALAWARINLFKSGKDQFKSCVGVIGLKDSSWECQYNKCTNLDKLKVNYCYEPAMNHGRLDESAVQCLKTVMCEMQDMVMNDSIYKLITILSMLDTDGLEFSAAYGEIFKLKTIYLKLFQRKLNAIGCSYVDYATFRTTLKKVRVLATLMESFFD